jgi:flagellar hook-basal body complex protein FliE
MAETNPIPSVEGKMSISPAAQSIGQPSGFEAMMNQQNNAQSMQGPASAGGPSGPSPMDLARPAGTPTAAPSFQSLLQQTQGLQDGLTKLQSPKVGLNHPQLKQPRNPGVSKGDQGMRPQQSGLLRGHLKNATNSINDAAAKLQLSGAPANGSGTLAHFLAWVGQGQDTMMSVQGKLQEMSKNPDSLNPADMLLVQTKMNQAQNEIQFSTTLLGKVVESFKTILQTQL